MQASLLSVQTLREDAPTGRPVGWAGGWVSVPGWTWEMMGFIPTPSRGLLALVSVSLCFAIVSADSTDVKCEKIYKDFSDCVLELGDSMDNYQENVTSERGVEAVCSHWEAFHTCALTALSDCQEEVGPIWETLREDSRKIRFQGSLFDLCAPSSTSSLRASLATLLPLPLLAGLITSVAAYA
ncbi:Neuritin [Merluccius polli]|uniref:Neuritin n=1 Tax=Merluccius polli TaxID=89951 RepID=A0AA47MSW6_MERPO|nr:Neuritin [Merluccius polli]